MRKTLGLASVVGLLLASVGTIVSHLSQTAQLPPELYGGNAVYLSSLKTLWRLPIEFLALIWFVSAGYVVCAPHVRRFRSADGIMFISGIVALGIWGGLSYTVGTKGVATLITAVLIAMVWGTHALALIPTQSGVRGWRGITVDAREMLADRTVRNQFVGAFVVFVLIGQYLALTAGSAGPAEREAQLVRWFLSRPQLTSHELTGAGQIRVVVFSDYQCPFCSIQVPELEKTVQKYRQAGYSSVQFVARDFPLHPDCNPAVSAPVHALACRASAAVNWLKRIKGESIAKELSARLYKRRGKFAPQDIDDYLSDVGAIESFNRDLPLELEKIRQDALAAQALGVTGTPSTFIDGRYVQNLTPRALDSILSYHLARAQATVAVR